MYSNLSDVAKCIMNKIIDSASMKFAISRFIWSRIRKLLILECQENDKLDWTNGCTVSIISSRENVNDNDFVILRWTELLPATISLYFLDNNTLIFMK